MNFERCAAFEALWPRLIKATVENTDGLGIIQEFTESIGLRYFSYEVYSDRPNHAKGMVLNNLPARYCENYNDNAQWEFDPMVMSFRTELLPFKNLDSRQIKEAKGLEYYLYAEARDAGIGQGLCVPVRGAQGQFAMLGVLDKGDLPAGLDPGTPLYNAVVAFTPYVQAYWDARQGLNDSPPISTTLSDVEKVCLGWSQHGKTSWEIAQIIGRAQSTVEHHLARAMHKLNAVNKVHAAATAVRLGLI